MIEPKNINRRPTKFWHLRLLGEGWEESLQQLADAAGAGGASLVRVQAGRHAAHLSSTEWSEFETAVMGADIPPSLSRYYLEHAYDGGFRVDHDVWTDEEMRRDPYFPEFLRPRGIVGSSTSCRSRTCPGSISRYRRRRRGAEARSAPPRGVPSSASTGPEIDGTGSADCDVA